MGDIITAINDMKVRNTQDPVDAFDKCKVGQEISVTILRIDEEVTVKLTLGGR